MIALFDSGFGGLSVLNHFHKKLPEYSYIYYGDSLNAPYGNKSEKEIYLFTKSAVDFLFSQGAVLVLVVCNTVSAKVLRNLQDNYFNKKYKNKKVLGIIIPNVENILKINKKNLRLGIIGTTHTINSQKYLKEIRKKSRDIKIFSKDCPGFARDIENGKFKTIEFSPNIKEEMEFFRDKNINHLLLACTHYSFIKNEIKKQFSLNTTIIDSSSIILNKTVDYLENHKELEIKKDASTLIFTSGNKEIFDKTAKKLLFKTPTRSLKFLKAPILPYN